MQKKYKDLTDMLENCQEAKQFYNSLPDYVRSTIKERGDNVLSEDSLHTYANNLLSGDD